MTSRKSSYVTILRRTLLPTWMDVWNGHSSELSGKDILHIGSGLAPFPGAVTLDMNAGVCPDHVCNIDEDRLPFADESFDAVLMFNVFEHVDQKIQVLEEIHRVLRMEGRVYILAPHFSSTSQHTDPTHKNGIGTRTLDYVVEKTDIGKNFGFYSNVRFSYIESMITLSRAWALVPGLTRLVNRYSASWEEYWCYIVRGAGLFWILRKEPNVLSDMPAKAPQ